MSKAGQCMAGFSHLAKAGELSEWGRGSPHQTKQGMFLLALQDAQTFRSKEKGAVSAFRLSRERGGNG